MKCIICGKPLVKYALIGKKNDMQVAFCTKHLPDCATCDSCDLRCVGCGKDVLKVMRLDDQECHVHQGPKML